MSEQTLVHVVLLRFLVTATAEQVADFLCGLDTLLRQTPDATNFTFGRDAGMAPDLDHYDFGLTVRFPDEQHYLAYEASEQHAKFVRTCASPIVASRATVQFWWPLALLSSPTQAAIRDGRTPR